MGSAHTEAWRWDSNTLDVMDLHSGLGGICYITRIFLLHHHVTESCSYSGRLRSASRLASGWVSDSGTVSLLTMWWVDCGKIRLL